MRNPTCTECQLGKMCLTVCLWGVGKLSSPIMVIGEAPGASEDAEGMPFLGKAGQVLNKALTAAGLSRNQIYITNAVKCRPPGNNIKDYPEAVKACAHYLQEEILEVKPKIIVALGNYALFALTGKKEITKQRGKLLDPKKGIDLGGAMLIGSIHPAYAARIDRNQSEGLGQQMIADDFKMAATLIGLATPVVQPVHYRIILEPGFSLDQLQLALTQIPYGDPVAIDLEWFGDDDTMSWPWSAKAELIAMSISGWANELHKSIVTVSIPWPEPGEDSEVIPIIQEFAVLHKYGGHNFISDGLYLRSKDLPYEPAFDTMARMYHIDEEQPRSLEVAASKLAKIPPTFKHTGVKFVRPKTLEEWSVLLTRNGDDTYATLIVEDAAKRQMDWLPTASRLDLVEDAPLYEWERKVLDGSQRDQTIRLYKNVTLPMIKLCIEMSSRGVPTNIQTVRLAVQWQEERLKIVVDKLAEELGFVGTYAETQTFLNSPARLKDALNKKIGYELFESTAKDVLSLYESTYPFLTEVREYRHIRNKLLGTYLRPWLHMLEEQS